MQNLAKIFLASCFLLGTLGAADEVPLLKRIQTIPLPDVAGRIDHLVDDAKLCPG